jgi:hypothetical protein
LVLVFAIRAQYWRQAGPGRFRFTGRKPRASTARMSLLTCEDCGTPLGVPPFPPK